METSIGFFLVKKLCFTTFSTKSLSIAGGISFSKLGFFKSNENLRESSKRMVSNSRYFFRKSISTAREMSTVRSKLSP